MLQQILNETVADDQKSLDYNQAQYDTGVGDYISVAEAKTTLEAAQAAAINVGLLRAQYEHAIAMLLGKLPTDFSIPVKPMVYAAPAIPTGVPSQLVERRPDIAAAERTLAEANAIIGIGYGAFFPQVTISAAGGFQSSALTNLFSGPSRTWSIGPSVAETIFNGFLYRAELHQYVAQYNADLANYRQVTLTAFQQVEDYMAATRIYSQQILRQQQAVKDAQDYLNLEYVALQHRSRSLCRCRDCANYAAEQPGDAQFASGGGDDFGGGTGAGAGRRMGPHTASHAAPGRRQNHQRGLQAAAVRLTAPAGSRWHRHQAGTLPSRRRLRRSWSRRRKVAGG